MILVIKKKSLLQVYLYIVVHLYHFFLTNILNLIFDDISDFATITEKLLTNFSKGAANRGEGGGGEKEFGGRNSDDGNLS